MVFLQKMEPLQELIFCGWKICLFP
jgi:hypothetical protein